MKKGVREILDEDLIDLSEDQLIIASHIKRIGSWLVDCFLVLFIFGSLFYFLETESKIVHLFYTATILFYKVVAEYYWGRSLGKWLMGIFVVKKDFSDLGFFSIVVRNIQFTLFWLLEFFNDLSFFAPISITELYYSFYLSVQSFIGYFFLPGILINLLFVFITPLRQSVSDLISQTMVVEKIKK